MFSEKNLWVHFAGSAASPTAQCAAPLTQPMQEAELGMAMAVGASGRCGPGREYSLKGRLEQGKQVLV